MAKNRTGFVFKRGGRYYIQWRVSGKLYSKALTGPDGKPVSNAKQAEAARLQHMAAFLAGDEVGVLKAISERIAGREAELVRLQDEQAPALELSKVWTAYASSTSRPDTGPSTMEQYGQQWHRFLRWTQEKHPGLGKLRDVTKEIAGQYATHLMGEGISSNTYNKHIGLLNLVWRSLQESANLPANPWASIKRRVISHQGRRAFSESELRLVITTATGELKILLSIGLFTGLRLKDACLLSWGDVDMARRIITIVPAKVARRKPAPVIIPLHPVLNELLGDLPKGGKYVLPAVAQRYLQGPYLVTDAVQNHFQKCGIKTQREGTGEGSGKRASVECGFHSLRHSFVSICRAANVPLSVVESIVGHSNPGMTRVYTHTSEESATAAIGLLPDVVNGTKALPAPPPPAEADPMPGIVATLESMTTDNWQARRDDLLARLRQLAQGAMVEL